MGPGRPGRPGRLERLGRLNISFAASGHSTAVFRASAASDDVEQTARTIVGTPSQSGASRISPPTSGRLAQGSRSRRHDHSSCAHSKATSPGLGTWPASAFCARSATPHGHWRRRGAPGGRPHHAGGGSQQPGPPPPRFEPWRWVVASAGPARWNHSAFGPDTALVLWWQSFPAPAAFRRYCPENLASGRWIDSPPTAIGCFESRCGTRSCSTRGS